MTPEHNETVTDKVVLLVIVAGLVAILLAVVLGIFITARPGFILPNWAENVLIAVGTGALLKFGDCLSALVALSSGRDVVHLGSRLADSVPAAGKNEGLNGKDRPAGTPEDPVTVEETDK